ncbi:TPA: hypothetical protein QHR58_004447 [Enterobacter kobei]|nr:hypothetical protein [Enterobacter kobei]
MSGKRHPEEFKIEVAKRVLERSNYVSGLSTRLDTTTHSLLRMDKELRSGLIH